MAQVRVEFATFDPSNGVKYQKQEPSLMKTTFTVIHTSKSSRFETTTDGHTAILDYILDGETITFTHTGVPSALEGRGIGSALVQEGLAYARKNNLKVVALCWFVDKYMKRHPEE
jgi:hypothetical protein